MTGPLAGRRVVVTRARAQASLLVERLRSLGATVVELPVITIEDPPDGGAGLVGAADRLVGGHYAWVVLTSVNAASRLLAALGTRAVPAGVKWAAVGAATAASLAEGGFPPDLVPGVAVSDALAEEFPEVPMLGSGAGTRVLFPRAEQVRDVVATGLEAKGWEVDEVVAYRTSPGRPRPESLAEARGADAVAFTSSSTVSNTVAVLGRDEVPPVVVSIGPVTSASARAAGLVVTAEASEQTIDGLVTAVVAVFGLDPVAE